MLRIFAEEVIRSPLAHTFLLLGVDFSIGTFDSVILVGNPDEESFQNLSRILNSNYLPNVVVKYYRPKKDDSEYKLLNNKATAYICSNRSCKPPTNSAERMLELLESK